MDKLGQQLSFLIPSSSTDTPPSCPDRHGMEFHLTWANVGIASSLLILNGALSLALSLNLEVSMIVASIRCVVQLSIMGSVLTPVLRNNENPYIVFGMATALLSLGCIEAYLNKAKYRHSWMFLNIFVSMLISMIVSCAIGIQFAIPTTPFFNARMFIPTIGMLLGNTISGMALGLRTCLSHFVEKRDQIELLLSFGAGRWETAQPILKESISTGLLPVLNAMSVVGLISIPGQMTGQILAGAPIDQAVHYQQIIMFLIFSSTALGTIISCIICIFICLDSTLRLRIDRITAEPFLNHQYISKIINFILCRDCCPREEEGENVNKDD